ncbi:uncharacterized protein BT62DRAFT_1080119 [Guyanagaster necrorhizus]|uniref:AMP-dependent synthetase/ligase domain-containing protein n=1 Tax=Guyanagaster necrorhizus TaxID=856835 RepID=A0A9P7VJ08_9AGAR|nr:uncharacterized protein BT62DRAFT_1080119 [Guyanagaster necrorhizus MCA 3950]KAG7441387.1 hypothetical protein BT62DRAFT_1080119 [Guyanagaster necrorhizus MCA 3950]
MTALPLELVQIIIPETIDGRDLKVWKNLWPSLRRLFLHSTKKHSDKTYIVYEKERYTFQETLEKAVKCAAILRDVYGVRKGDRVTICSHKLSELLGKLPGAKQVSSEVLGGIDPYADPPDREGWITGITDGTVSSNRLPLA